MAYCDYKNFISQKMKERYPKLIEELREKSADVICLQEVTSSLLKLLCSDEFIRQNYCISDTESSSKSTWKTWYNTSILVKHKLASSLKRVDFPSKQGRNLLLAELVLSKK